MADFLSFPRFGGAAAPTIARFSYRSPVLSSPRKPTLVPEAARPTLADVTPRRVSPPYHLLRRLSVTRLALGSIALGPLFCLVDRLTSFKSHSILFTPGKTKLTNLLSKFSFRSYKYMYYIDNLRSLKHHKIHVINSDYLIVL